MGIWILALATVFRGSSIFSYLLDTIAICAKCFFTNSSCMLALQMINCVALTMVLTRVESIADGYDRLVWAASISCLAPVCLSQNDHRVLEPGWQCSSPEWLNGSTAMPGHLLPRWDRPWAWLFPLILAQTFRCRILLERSNVHGSMGEYVSICVM